MSASASGVGQGLDLGVALGVDLDLDLGMDLGVDRGEGSGCRAGRGARAYLHGRCCGHVGSACLHIYPAAITPGAQVRLVRGTGLVVSG